MRDFIRYAIYFAPQGRLAAFGACWIGWDIVAGAPRAHPDVAGLSRPVEAITATPRRYGFHGTLKPPFRLAEGTEPGELAAALAKLAKGGKPVVCDGLALTSIGAFLALVPTGDQAALAALAARVVAELDSFRAQAGLSSRQDDLLLR